MEIVYEIVYDKRVAENDIKKLGQTARSRIKKAIEKKLMSHPEMYSRPLRKSLQGFRKLRVDDYRVVFSVDKGRVKIFVIQHRSTVYKITRKRLQ